MSCHVEQYRFRIYFRLSFRIMIFSLMWNVNSRRVPISITEVLCFKFHIIKKKNPLTFLCNKNEENSQNYYCTYVNFFFQFIFNFKRKYGRPYGIHFFHKFQTLGCCRIVAFI